MHKETRYFKTNSSGKKMFFVLLMLIVSNPELEAKLYYYRPSENIILEDVNPTISKKIKTRYGNANEINNQYKGKLIYLPTTVNNLRSFRKKRFYSSIYVADTAPVISSGYRYDAVDGKTDLAISNIEASEVTFVIDAGFYNYDAMALEIEYISTKYTINLAETINDSSSQSINGIILDTYAYFLNMLFESNYSSMIPFFGVGIGIISHNINTFFNNGVGTLSNFSVSASPAYNIFAGVEFALNNDFLFTVRYKTIVSLDAKIIQRNTKTDKIGFSFRNNFISAGIKYIW
ncbi:MAG: hypothetical protein LBG48_02805 [Rickettsiales bacterium]|nr:hypothetical protein [Rickettsiales bacterium]